MHIMISSWKKTVIPGIGRDRLIKHCMYGLGAGNGLEYYFNYHSSPDLSPIKNCWQPVMQNLHNNPHWDDNTKKN